MINKKLIIYFYHFLKLVSEKNDAIYVIKKNNFCR